MKKAQAPVNLKLLLPRPLHTRLKVHAAVQQTTLVDAALQVLDKHLPKAPAPRK